MSNTTTTTRKRPKELSNRIANCQRQIAAVLKWDEHDTTKERNQRFAALMREHDWPEVAAMYDARCTDKALLADALWALVSVLQNDADGPLPSCFDSGGGDAEVKAVRKALHDDLSHSVEDLAELLGAMGDGKLAKFCGLVSDRAVSRLTQAVREIANACDHWAAVRRLKVPRGLEIEQ